MHVSGPIKQEQRVVEPPREFAQKLRSLRESHGLSVRALAGMVGVSSVTIWKWEKGESSPRPRLLVPLAKALDVSPNQLRPLGTDDEHAPVVTAPEPPLPPKGSEAQQPAAAEDAQFEVLADVIAKAKQMIAEVSGIGANNITIRIEY